MFICKMSHPFYPPDKHTCVQANIEYIINSKQNVSTKLSKYHFALLHIRIRVLKGPYLYSYPYFPNLLYIFHGDV